MIHVDYLKQMIARSVRKVDDTAMSNTAFNKPNLKENAIFVNESPAMLTSRFCMLGHDV